MVRLLMVLLLLLLLSGCDSDGERNEGYLRELNAAQATFATTATRIARNQQDGDTLNADRRTLQRYQRALDTVVGELRRIEAPDKVRGEHGRLVAAMSSFRMDITSAIDALRDPTRSRVDRAQTTLSEALPQLNARLRSAADAINRKLGVT